MFLSVIMPVYNGERYIASALDSVCAQGSNAIELVVVDDGSSDSTLEIVKRYEKFLPIQIIEAGRIGNWVAVSNLGLQNAKGEWACFLHHDDLWMPERMARFQSAAEGFGGVLIISNSIFVGPNGKNLGLWTCPLPEGDVSSDVLLEHLLVQNFIGMPAPVFRRRAVLDSGGMDASLWHTADWDLWLRLGKMGTVRFIAQPLTAFRIHPHSQTSARRIEPGEWTRAAFHRL